MEILQNCPIFNDTPFEAMKSADRRLYLEEGEPMRFGDQAVSLDRASLSPRVTPADQGDEPLAHDSRNAALARILADMTEPPLPTPLGVLYREDRPVHHDLMRGQVHKREGNGLARLQERLASGPTWRVT